MRYLGHTDKKKLFNWAYYCFYFLGKLGNPNMNGNVLEVRFKVQ